ncbi:MAG: ABC transporter ATP-binding protein [Pirellulaceae bacterium]|nr:ABC transporter ATP-binding protein [Pirellulaceae bacterium]
MSSQHTSHMVPSGTPTQGGQPQHKDHADLTAPLKPADATTSVACELPIWMDRVSKWYGAVIGVNEVSLQVAGGIVGLLGPNGAGKSTLMKLLTGQLRPNLGQIRIYGQSVRSVAARRKLGYAPDVDAYFEEMTGRQFVQTMLRLAGYRQNETQHLAQRALETVGMSGSRADKVLRGCSKGMRQRIKLAQAIAHDPDLLILDEPLSGLDPVGRREFCQLFNDLSRQGKTLLVSSHVLEEVEQITDSVILVGSGRVLTQGSWGDVSSFLNDLPQQVHIVSDRIREFVGGLIQWPGVIDVHFRGNDQCVLTTRDPSGLCAEIGRLVCQHQYRVDHLESEAGWAEALFHLAEAQ